MYTLVCMCAHACMYFSVVQALGPWEYCRSFSRAHIAMNGGWQAAWPAANTFTKWLALVWVGWRCPVNRLWWRDLSQSQLEATPTLPSKMHLPCVLFSKQAGNYKKLALLIIIHSSPGHRCVNFLSSDMIKMLIFLLHSVTDQTVCLLMRGSAVLSALGHLLDCTWEQCHLDVRQLGTTPKQQQRTI